MARLYSQQKVEAQTAVADMIQELRSDPRRYQALRKKVKAAGTDKERAALLLDFSMREETIKRHIPVGNNEFAWTITTITTVFIPFTAL